MAIGTQISLQTEIWLPKGKLWSHWPMTLMDTRTIRQLDWTPNDDHLFWGTRKSIDGILPSRMNPVKMGNPKNVSRFFKWIFSICLIRYVSKIILLVISIIYTCIYTWIHIYIYIHSFHSEAVGSYYIYVHMLILYIYIHNII